MPSKNLDAKTKALVAYIPALHAGYLQFFDKHTGAPVFVLGASFIDAYPRLNRDLRALSPRQIASILSHLGYNATVLEVGGVQQLRAFKKIILPEEDVSVAFAKKYVPRKASFENIFLRWEGIRPDKQKELTPDRTVSYEKLDQELMRRALSEGQKSADWWRQIGALLVKNKKILFASHIRYFPSDLALDIFGTPRMTVDFGERPDLYISMHSEADLIAQAGHAGVSTKGLSIYTSTFPCMNCAFLIARAGIKRVYYSAGYSNIDSENVLKNAGVELVFVAGA